MKKVILLSLLILGGLISCGQPKTTEETKSEENKIVVGLSGGYYPFGFVENDELQGFDVDVFNAIGEKLGYEIKFETAEFSGLFGLLDIKKIDTIANQITITDERKAKYLFSTPYVYDGAQIVVKKGNKSIKSLEDLKGKKVGVDLGSNYEELVKNYDVNNEIEIITYDSGSSMIEDTVLGRIDAYIMDRNSAATSIREKNIEVELASEPFEIIENGYPFVNDENNKVLVEKINKALEELRSEGKLKEISEKWLGIDVTSKK